MDLLGLEIERGDLFVICCDGLTNLVDDSEIASMARTESVQDLPLRLIGLANDRGGDDNITVVALEIDEVPGRLLSRQGIIKPEPKRGSVAEIKVPAVGDKLLPCRSL